MIEEVLTVEDTAQLLKVTPTTIRRWCASGRLPAFKIGREWRIRRASLEELMGSREEANADREPVRPSRTSDPRAEERGTEIAESLWFQIVKGYQTGTRKEGEGSG